MWIQQCALIINKNLIVAFDRFSNIAKHLVKAKTISSKSTIIFEELLMLILMQDFYHIFPIIGYSLWENIYIEEDFYGKMI